MSNVIPFPREFRKPLEQQMETIFGKPATPDKVAAFERLSDALKAYRQRQIKDRNDGGPNNAA